MILGVFKGPKPFRSDSMALRPVLKRLRKQSRPWQDVVAYEFTLKQRETGPVALLSSRNTWEPICCAHLGTY